MRLNAHGAPASEPRRTDLGVRGLDDDVLDPVIPEVNRDQRSAPRGAPLDLIGKPPLAYPVVVADDLFKALADPTRRTILDVLTEKSGQTLFEICSRLSVKHQVGISRQAISQHLAVLETAGLVETRREGRYKFHDLNTAPLRQIAERWPVPDTSGSEESTP